MKRIILLFALVALAFAVGAQTLDRISMSTGGATCYNISYVLGEVFNFTMTSEGNITIETGSMSSTQNTGGDIPTIILDQLASAQSQIECYPNPVSDLLTVNFNGVEGVTDVVVFNGVGQVMLCVKPTGDKSYLAMQNLTPGTYFVTCLNGKNVIAVNKIVKE